MQFNKRSDLLLNVIVPLLLGLLLYWAGKAIFLPAPVRNYLPDSLWAYAFISSILIVWDREINFAWITPVFIISICFELLQYGHIIHGTGDFTDIIAYLLSFTIALKLNSSFRTLFPPNLINHE
jgi:hypothetical protein